MNDRFKYKSMCNFDITQHLEDGWGYIYSIDNIITKQVYIGSAYEWKKRFRSHINTLNNNNHRNKFLQNSWNKYGQENFKFNIIISVFDKDNLSFVEQRYLDNYFLTSKNKMFNINKFVDTGFKGRKHTEETKRKMSLKRMGVSLTKGSKNPNVKLTENDVREIRKLYKTKKYTFADLGKMYGVCYNNISSIVKYKIWKEI